MSILPLVSNFQELLQVKRNRVNPLKHQSDCLCCCVDSSSYGEEIRFSQEIDYLVFSWKLYEFFYEFLLDYNAIRYHEHLLAHQSHHVHEILTISIEALLELSRETNTVFFKEELITEALRLIDSVATSDPSIFRVLNIQADFSSLLLLCSSKFQGKCELLHEIFEFTESMISQNPFCYVDFSTIIRFLEIFENDPVLLTTLMKMLRNSCLDKSEGIEPGKKLGLVFLCLNSLLRAYYNEVGIEIFDEIFINTVFEVLKMIIIKISKDSYVTFQITKEHSLLVWSLLNKFEHSHCQVEVLCLLLAYLTLNFGNQAIFNENQGLIPFLFRLIQTYYPHSKLISILSVCLGHLSAFDGNRAVFGQENFILILLKLLSRFTVNTKENLTLVWLLITTFRACFRDSNNLRKLIRERGLQIILELVLKNQEVPQIVKIALSIIGICFRQSPEILEIKSQLPDDFQNSCFQVLESYRHDLFIARHLVVILLRWKSIVKPNTHFSHQEFLQIIEVLKVHNESSLVAASIKLILLICKDSEIQQRVHKTGAIRVLLNLLRTKAEDRWLVSRTFKILWSFSIYDDNCKEIGELDGCEAIIDCLEISRRPPSMCIAFCGLISNLAVIEQNSEIIGDCGGCEAVLKIISKLRSTSIDAVRFGSVAIANLAQDPLNQSRFLQRNGVLILQNCIAIPETIKAIRILQEA